MALSEILRERGYVYQHSSETLEEITDREKRTIYWGVDPTADSLHIGHLMGVIAVRRFLEDDHRLIVIVGGGTGMIGDPGGKSEERNLLSDETVGRNSEALRAQFSQLFDGMDFEMLNNAQWLKSANLMEFLRDVGKHFTVNEMLKRDSVRPRIEAPDQSISFTEFSYMILQAYDFLYLNTNHSTDVQVGASDQWGNMVSGVDLIRRKTGNAAYAFSWPLLVNKSTGKKFGKSESGTVWLDAEKTSPFQFYQFWFNTEDDMVEELLLKMTLLPQKEIEAVMAAHRLNPGERIAQKELGFRVTSIVHGEDVASQQQNISEVLFGDDTAAVDGPIAELLHKGPTCAVSSGTSIVDTLVASDLASSKREARQFIADKAVTLNGAAIDESKTISAEDFTHGVSILKRGKRNVVVLTKNG
jgi:tyrosyl-tRNA synthetase